MQSVNKGKKIIIGLIVLILLFDIATTAITSTLYANTGRVQYASFKLMQGIFRFLLTGVICYFLYKGHKWANWLTIVLFLLSGLGAIISLLSVFSLILLVMGIVYLGIGITLIVSNSVKDFLRYQRGEISIGEGISNNSEQGLQ